MTPVISKDWILTEDTDTRTGTTLGTNIGSATPTKIADNFIALNTSSGPAGTVYQTNTTENATLLSFLNSLYDTYGAVAWNYAILRVNTDADLTDTVTQQNIRFGGSHQTSPDRRAVLNVTVVPEPATTMLIGLVGDAFLAQRRRRLVTR